jgi:hypothetical protein
MANTDTRQLQLQISASAELLIRNLKTADNAVADFQQSTNKRLASIDDRYAALGKLKGGLGAIDSKVGLGGLVGAATGATLIELGGRALDYASSLQEVAQQLGVTTTDLQTYRYAATQVGISQETMDKGLAKLTVTMGQAREGVSKPKAAFAELSTILGKDVLKGAATAGDALPLIADALNKISDPAKRAALEVALFGKTGQQLDTLLQPGSAALNGLARAAQDLGLVLSDDQIANADQTADKLAEVKQILEANIASAVANNVSAIYALANAFESLVVKAGQAAEAIANFSNLQGFKAGDIGSGLALGKTKTGRTTAINELSGLIAQNEKDRARGQGNRSSYLGGLVEFTSPADAKENQRLDEQFKKLVRLRNAYLHLDRASDAAAGRTGGTPRPGGEGAGTSAADANAAARKAAAEAARASREAAAAAKKDRQDQRKAGDELAKAQLDSASAHADLSGDPDERLQIEQDRVDLARKAKDSDLESAAIDNRYIAANLDRLKAINADTAETDKQILRRKRAQDVEQSAFDRQRAGEEDQLALLEIQSRLTVVAKDRNALELRILALRQQEEREALERIAGDTTGRFSKEDRALAADQLTRLPAREAAERQSLQKDQQGPVSNYRDKLVAATGDMNEALQNVEVNGLQSLEDGLLGIIDGTESVGSAFKKMASSIIADLARIAIEKAIVSAIGGSFFGLKLAGGGKIEGKAGGGRISGAGSGTSDSIFALIDGRKPLMVSNGESIVTAAATSRYWPIIDAMNRGTLPRLATGGAIGRVTASRMPALGGLPGQAAPQVIYVKVDKSDLFDVHVQRAAAPLADAAAARGAAGGAQMAQDEAGWKQSWALS